MATAADDLAARRALSAAVIFQHPLRVAVLERVAERGRSSPRELADDLCEPIGNVAYHVKVLRRLELLQPAGEAQRRGAVEHFYRADRRLTEALDHLTLRVAALRGRIDRNGGGS